MSESSIPMCEAAQADVAAPGFQLPPLACDTHAHVFGPSSQYPYTPNRTYTPPDALLEQYIDLHNTLGIQRGVLVQPSVYGTDNRAMLDAMAQLGDRYRAVAVVPADISMAELRQLHQQGVRGIRVNLLFKGGINFDDMKVLAGKIRQLDWHLQVLVDVSDFDNLFEVLMKLEVPIVVDHMGHMPAQLGTGHEGFSTLLRLLDTGQCWVKLSGSYRITEQDSTPYTNVQPVARRLIDHRLDRMVWGSDWPHPCFNRPMPNDGALLDMLAQWAPEETERERILVTNPAKLYDF